MACALVTCLLEIAFKIMYLTCKPWIMNFIYWMQPPCISAEFKIQLFTHRSNGNDYAEITMRIWYYNGYRITIVFNIFLPTTLLHNKHFFLIG